MHVRIGTAEIYNQAPQDGNDSLSKSPRGEAQALWARRAFVAAALEAGILAGD
jgi:hypothetical protein